MGNQDRLSRARSSLTDSSEWSWNESENEIVKKARAEMEMDSTIGNSYVILSDMISLSTFHLLSLRNAQLHRWGVPILHISRKILQQI